MAYECENPLLDGSTGENPQRIVREQLKEIRGGKDVRVTNRWYIHHLYPYLSMMRVPHRVAPQEGVHVIISAVFRAG